MDEHGSMLESCCLAGPDGDGHRKMFAQNARLVHTFTAGSHFEAMTIYYRFIGRGPYTTEFQWDYESYPAEWLARQKSAAT